MNDVLRSTTIQLEFQGQDGITGVRQFTRAITDADDVVDKLSKELGENTKVTAKNVRSKRELTADARRLVSQMERNKRKMRELTRLYEHQSKAVNRTANEQEVLNAVYKLGANATQKQKDEITRIVQNYQKLRVETSKNTRGFRNLRGVSQNLGWQLQDVAVQAQMGTSAFTIFAQQGSQMASSFGPAGALVGALIAVGGALLGVAFASDKAKEEAKLLEETEFDLLKTLRDQAKELRFLEAAQIRVLKVQDEKLLKKYRDELELVTAKLQTRRNTMRMSAKEEAEYSKELDRTRATYSVLTQKIEEIETRTKSYNENLDETNKLEKDRRDTLKDIIKSYELEASSIGLSARAIAINNAEKLKATQIDKDRINAAFDLLEAEERRAEAEKESLKNATKIRKMFEAESKALTKQTESIEQEYTRRKKVIDDFVSFIGLSNEKTKAAYLNLQVWRNEQLDKETEKTIREYNKREAARRHIEKAQTKQLGGSDGGIGVENELFINNLKILNDQKKILGEEELAEKQRIDQLIEQEVARHESKMIDLNDESLKAGVAVFAMGSQQITALADMMTNGVQQVESATSEMNAGQKAAFLFSQAIAATMAFINGVSLGGKLAEMFPLMAPSMITLGTTIGAANAGAIMGATIAGTFDKGGNIPSGQLGIVSEYGDELVNGQLIKGPAKVTSREDTAKMMGGGETKIIIENKIDGARFTEQRVDGNTMKIIAEQVFSDNIDKGVSGVLGNRNSKSTKALKSKFTVRSSY